MSGPSQTCSSAVAGELGCAGAPAALAARLLEQSTACQQFVLYLCFQVGKAKGNMQMRSLRAKSCQLSAWLLAVPHCWCPAPPGHPVLLCRWALQWFSFYFVFFYMQPILYGMRGSTAAKSMYQGTLFCHLFCLSLYFLPVTASVGS